MSQNNEILNTFEAVRLRAYNFCAHRNWEKFHLPTSLALALSGECGEVCEIFQWKGTLEEEWEDQGSKAFTEKELIHIGEEIADVCIYTTRLCDICNINLGRSVIEEIQAKFSPYLRCAIQDVSRPWPSDITLTDLSATLSTKIHSYPSPRSVSLELQSKVGNLCSIFAQHTEIDCAAGLPSWNLEDRALLASNAANIFILMMCLASMCNLSVGQCITDKFLKNDIKYPVNLARGSSAKYTVYAKSQSLDKVRIIGGLVIIGVACLSFFTGKYVALRRMK